MFFIYASLLLTFVITAFILKLSTPKNQPPSPWKLPIIGHMHHLAFVGGPPHRCLRHLSHTFGDLMFLQLGEIPTVVVSSSRLAREFMKTHDLAFASRPEFLFSKVIFYDASDVLCCQYGDSWRQMRKLCTMELLTAKRVQSFGWIRQDEVRNLVDSIKSHHLVGNAAPVNLTHKLKSYNSSMVMRAALGEFTEEDHVAFLQLIEDVLSFATSFEVSDLFPSLKFLRPFLSVKGEMIKVQRRLNHVLDGIIEQHLARTTSDRGEDLLDVLLRVQKTGDLPIPMTKNNIKAVLLDLFIGGTETTASTAEWAMAELITHPDAMAKAQSEIRQAFGENRTTIEEAEIQELKYLKLVVKETLRLHPAGPLLFPRESRQETKVDGYNIPTKTRVMINAWAIGRDPEHWDDPENFKPERFEDNSIDFAGSHFDFLPFGSGRRMCPGMTFGLANVYLPLALLLYHFDWELPGGLNPSHLDMTETVGITASRTTELLLLPKVIN